MRIVQGPPPNYAELVAAFPDIKGRTDIVFSWGPSVYVLNRNCVLTPSVRAHEEVHGARQINDVAKIEGWWRRYVEDPQFRLKEELEAHRVEYRTYCSNTLDRNRRARYLQFMAQRFASPMYGGLISLAKAKAAIQK
jgi:hypothetical protein